MPSLQDRNPGTSWSCDSHMECSPEPILVCGFCSRQRPVHCCLVTSEWIFCQNSFRLASRLWTWQKLNLLKLSNFPLVCSQGVDMGSFWAIFYPDFGLVFLKPVNWCVSNSGQCQETTEFNVLVSRCLPYTWSHLHWDCVWDIVEYYIETQMLSVICRRLQGVAIGTMHMLVW